MEPNTQMSIYVTIPSAIDHRRGAFGDFYPTGAGKISRSMGVYGVRIFFYLLYRSAETEDRPYNYISKLSTA